MLRRTGAVLLAALCLSGGALAAAPAQESPSPLPPELFAGRQAHRIATAIASMPVNHDGPQTFFVGFAGYGEQTVFRKEEELAQRVLGEHFGVEARSLSLVNDVHDRHSYPLATVENLRYALALLGRRMDPERDVLILMLTSHGSREDGIAVTNDDLVDDDLTPEDLRDALDDAGIRWRIVVASACYAGVFLKPLESETTLILTAADSRHSSFGCADDRDLTYFGEALLKDSLPVSCTLEQAFASAQRIVRERETAEGEPHSNPQIYVGARMRALLATLEGAPPRVAEAPGARTAPRSTSCSAPASLEARPERSH